VALGTRHGEAVGKERSVVVECHDCTSILSVQPIYNPLGGLDGVA
jgi:hypothetical protein